MRLYVVFGLWLLVTTGSAASGCTRGFVDAAAESSGGGWSIGSGCGGTAKAPSAEDPIWSVSGAMPIPDGVFAEPELLEALRWVPDGADAVKFLRLPSDLDRMLDDLAVEPEEGGPMLLESLIPELPHVVSDDGPGTLAVLWTRLPHAGMVLHPAPREGRTRERLEMAIMSSAEVEREEVERFGERWTRLREAGRPPSLRARVEVLLRVHRGRLLVLLAPVSTGEEAEEERVAALLGALGEELSSDAERSVLVRELERRITEALQPDEAADEAVFHWASGALGGGVDAALTRPLRNLALGQSEGSRPAAVASAALPAASRASELLGASLALDDLVLGRTGSESAPGVFEQVRRAVHQCHDRGDAGMPHTRAVGGHDGVTQERWTLQGTVDVADPHARRVIMRTLPSTHPVEWWGSTSSPLRTAAAERDFRGCRDRVPDGPELALDVVGVEGRLPSFPAFGEPGQGSHGPDIGPVARLVDRLRQNGRLTVDTERGELVLQMLAPPPVAAHLDAWLEALPSLVPDEGNTVEAGVLTAGVARLSWQSLPEFSDNVDREGPLLVWTLQLPLDGGPPGSDVEVPFGVVEHLPIDLIAREWREWDHGPTIDALTLPFVHAGMTSHLGTLARPTLTDLLAVAFPYARSRSSVTTIGTMLHVDEFMPLIPSAPDGDPFAGAHPERRGRAAIAWRESLVGGSLALLGDPAAVTLALLDALPGSAPTTDQASAGHHFLPVDFASADLIAGAHVLTLGDAPGLGPAVELEGQPALGHRHGTRNTPAVIELEVGRPVVLHGSGAPLLLAFRSADGEPATEPFAVADVSGVPRVHGSVLDAVFGAPGGARRGAVLRADEPLSLRLVCVHGCARRDLALLVFQ